MWGRLFKKGVEYAEYAGEVLAPSNRTKLEHFQQNWSKIPELISDQSVFEKGRDGEDDSHVFDLLNEMLDLLIEEEDESENMGQCMEFLLEKNILRTMVSVGQAGFPQGMMEEILKFFTHLHTDIKGMALIPHQNVYNPIKVLLKVFVPKVKPHHQLALIDYLVALCVKLAQQPNLSELFTEAKDQKIIFLPLVVLQNLLPNQNEEIKIKSMACLKTIIALRTPTINAILLETKIASEFICRILTTSFKALSPVMDEGDDSQMHLVKFITEPFDGWKRFAPSKQHAPGPTMAFLAFMDYIHFSDDVTEDCDVRVATQITSMIKTVLLQQHVGPMLEQHAEDEAFTATSYVTACITQISSPPLLNVFTQFIRCRSE